MKSKLILVFLLVLALQYQTSYGGVLKDFFGKVEDTAQKVREDVKNTIFPHSNKQKEAETTSTTTAASTTVKIENTTEHASSTKKTESTSSKVTTTSEATVTTTTEATITTTTISSKDVTTGKDGRENFSGGCSTGFQRTSDGRCKPTF